MTELSFIARSRSFCTLENSIFGVVPFLGTGGVGDWDDGIEKLLFYRHVLFFEVRSHRDYTSQVVMLFRLQVEVSRYIEVPSQYTG